MNMEYYDLAFEVDAYVFRNKYPGLILPVSRSAAMAIKDSCEMREGGYRIYRDSMEHWVHKTCILDSSRALPEKYIPIVRIAKYKGDINEIARRIEMYNKRIRDTGDSILVFRGKVDKEGILSNLELIVGQKSDYSYLIERDLIDWYKSSWIPGKLLERNSLIETFVKIFIRANKNGTVTVLTSPREPGNITGR